MVISPTGCVFGARVQFHPHVPTRLPQGLLGLPPNVQNLYHHNRHVRHHSHHDMIATVILVHNTPRSTTLEAWVARVATRLPRVLSFFWPLYYRWILQRPTDYYTVRMFTQLYTIRLVIRRNIRLGKGVTNICCRPIHLFQYARDWDSQLSWLTWPFLKFTSQTTIADFTTLFRSHHYCQNPNW